MTTATYTAELAGDTYRIRADFAQSADQIQYDNEDGDWIASGRQVADVAHDSDKAMQWHLEESYLDGLTDADHEEIAEAVAEMEVIYDE